MHKVGTWYRSEKTANFDVRRRRGENYDIRRRTRGMDIDIVNKDTQDGECILPGSTMYLAMHTEISSRRRACGYNVCICTYSGT